MFVVSSRFGYSLLTQKTYVLVVLVEIRLGPTIIHGIVSTTAKRVLRAAISVNAKQLKSRTHLKIPLNERPGYEIYRSVADGSLDPSSLPNSQKVELLSYLTGDFYPKDELAAHMGTDRQFIHSVMAAHKKRIAARELPDDTHPDVVARESLDLRDRIIYTALSLGQPNVALKAMTEMTKLLMDIGALEKQPERVMIVDQEYRVSFGDDGTIQNEVIEIDVDDGSEVDGESEGVDSHHVLEYVVEDEEQPED